MESFLCSIRILKIIMNDRVVKREIEKHKGKTLSILHIE